MPREIRLLPITSVYAERLPWKGIREWMERYTLKALLDPTSVKPIKVQRMGNGRYRVKDGRHRLLLHKICGFDKIWARVSVTDNTPGFIKREIRFGDH